ncbi:MAG: glycosyl transferase [Solirubrobacterales bacterium]|nr:glycosyl transferase [Solirubrobacterales bacterium]
MTWGCVVLTQGKRPADLRAAIDSLLMQEGVETDVVVVGNGWEPEGLPAGVRGIHLPEDRGIPAGRNAGVAHTTGELLFFLDDDAALAEPDALAFVTELLHPPKGARPLSEGGRGLVGLAQLRVEPRGEGRSRDWVPRLRVGDPTRPSDVAALWEGAVAIPRAVFEEVGGWPEEFRFVHEGVDLAWRVLDAGYRVRYAAERSVSHPSPDRVTARHGYSTYYGARNRVFLARRNLPAPLGALFVASFALRTLPHLRTREQRRSAWRGYRDGLREPCGPRRRLRARTLWAMTRAGRPPVL